MNLYDVFKRIDELAFEVCSTCGGSGKLNGHLCQDCDGTGMSERKEEKKKNNKKKEGE